MWLHITKTVFSLKQSNNCSYWNNFSAQKVALSFRMFRFECILTQNYINFPMGPIIKRHCVSVWHERAMTFPLTTLLSSNNIVTICLYIPGIDFSINTGTFKIKHKVTWGHWSYYWFNVIHENNKRLEYTLFNICVLSLK